MHSPANATNARPVITPISALLFVLRTRRSEVRILSSAPTFFLNRLTASPQDFPIECIHHNLLIFGGDYASHDSYPNAIGSDRLLGSCSRRSNQASFFCPAEDGIRVF